MQASQLVREVQKSKIRVMYDLASKMENTLSFTVGEPDFQTPKPIIDEACKYLQMGYTHYTPNLGILPLRQAIAEKYTPIVRPIDPEREVIVTIGASEALVVAMAAVMDPGDEIIIPAPYFTSYLPQVRFVRCNPVFVDTYMQNGFIPRVEDIERAITPQTKMILLNSPNNPTGAEIDEGTLRQIAALAIKHDLVVITDEVYRQIRYVDTPYFSLASMPEMYDRTVLIDAFSKTYAMTGWRMGYAIGPEWIISQMPKTHDVLVSGVNAAFQYAGVYALKHCDDEVIKMREIFRKRKDVIVNGIRSIKGLSCLDPKGTFYLFVDIKELGVASEAFCMGLLKETGCVIVPGSGFGACGEGFVRITFAANEDMLTDGLNRIETYVNKLRRA